jgi:uncharacterized membrane-anchored protein YhcB (DUF1043 family)
VTGSVMWFLVSVALLVGFVVGLLVGRGSRYRASRVNVHSAERRQMFIKAAEL